MHSFFEVVDGVRIHYEKVGRGPQVLLMIPGAIGTAEIDFPDQIDGGLDQELFTLIVIELPGFGRSRPPERVYSTDQFRNDASKAARLMDKLGYRLYSVLGWCHGAKVALLLAINQLARVDKLIIWGAYLHVTNYELVALSKLRDIRAFDSRSQELHSRVYGWELFEQLWHGYVDAFVNFPGDHREIFDVSKEAHSISCPTLILHGDRDPFLGRDHPFRLAEVIANSRLVRIPGGSHNLHQARAQIFNKTVTEFLLAAQAVVASPIRGHK